MLTCRSVLGLFSIPSLEPFHDLLRSRTRKARRIIYRLVLSLRSQFFQPSALSSRSEESLDDPSLWHDGEGVQRAAFDDLDACPELLPDHGQRTIAVRHLDRRDSDCMELVLAYRPRGGA